MLQVWGRNEKGNTSARVITWKWRPLTRCKSKHQRQFRPAWTSGVPLRLLLLARELDIQCMFEWRAGLFSISNPCRKRSILQEIDLAGVCLLTCHNTWTTIPRSQSESDFCFHRSGSHRDYISQALKNTVQISVNSRNHRPGSRR